jgi:hypothetical protein
VVIQRGHGHEQVRLSWVQYRGAHFASLRIWSRSAAGEHRPTPRGIHLRPGELREIHAALEAAIQLAEREDAEGAG